jgi:hypothetical protein
VFKGSNLTTSTNLKFSSFGSMCSTQLQIVTFQEIVHEVKFHKACHNFP